MEYYVIVYQYQLKISVKQYQLKVLTALAVISFIYNNMFFCNLKSIIFNE